MPRTIWKMLCLSLLFSLLVGPAISAETVPVYTISDPNGDWGFPSPYSHYSRGPGYIRMSFIFDTLIWKDQNGFVPALAEKWEYLKNENAYLFSLRKDATWQDGEKFMAKDVVFTFNYVKAHPYQWVDLSTVDRAEVAGDYGVKICLKKPYAPFLDQVAGTLPIIPEHIYKDVQNAEQLRDSKALIGTGPFKLVDYNKAQGTYLYNAYDGYYQGAPKVKQLKFVKLTDEMAGPAIKNGDINAAGVPPEAAAELKNGKFVVMESAHDWAAKLMINHQKEPFSDVRFRQALAYAIDRQALVDKALRGYGLAGSPGLYASDNDWHNPNAEQYAYNPGKAGDLIREMGYSKEGQFFSKDGKTLEVELLITSSTQSAGELLMNQLEKAGIKTNLRSIDSKTLDSNVGGWKFDLALSGHGGLGGDPTILNRVITGQGFNSARFNSGKKLNDLLDQQIAELDPAKRKELVDEVQAVYAQDMPALPLYYTTSYWVHDGKVNLYYTKGGVANGVPIALNKMSFV